MKSRLTSDPAFASVALFLGIVVAGFVAIGFGWRVAARTLFVPAQVPAILSGGFAGLALVLIGAGLVTVQLERRSNALERAQTEDLLDEASALVEAYKDRLTDRRTA